MITSEIPIRSGKEPCSHDQSTATSEITQQAISGNLFIPPEIHQMIVPYLRNSDLCNYRLASKKLADIALEELFQIIKVHASRVSVARLENIADDPTLRTHVRHLVWDTNRWDLFPTHEGGELRQFNRFWVANLLESLNVAAMPTYQPTTKRILGF
jgi:hypothetical protein